MNGKCPEHPNRELEIVEEENYFFRIFEVSGGTLSLYREQSQFVVPEKRLNEIVAFVERGLQDFSISRLVSKMPWGYSVPDDEEHVMYVWFDALVNYISTIGWNVDQEQFEKFWPGADCRERTIFVSRRRCGRRCSVRRTCSVKANTLSMDTSPQWTEDVEESWECCFARRDD